MKLNWKVVSVRLEIVLILTQDTFAVCVERTIGSEIVLDAPDGTPDGCTIGTDIIFNAPMAQVEARFSPCRDSANLDAR